MKTWVANHFKIKRAEWTGPFLEKKKSSYDEELCLKAIFKSKRKKYMFGFLGVF